MWVRDRHEVSSLSDGWGCCTMDTTMAARECRQKCRPNQRTRWGEHRCLDVKMANYPENDPRYAVFWTFSTSSFHREQNSCCSTGRVLPMSNFESFCRAWNDDGSRSVRKSRVMRIRLAEYIYFRTWLLQTKEKRAISNTV